MSRLLTGKSRRSTSASLLTAVYTEVRQLFPPLVLSLKRKLTCDTVVIAGTNGEAAALTREEKSELIRLARSLAPSSLPITAGCNGGCTRAVIEDIQAAHTAGADYALVLVPSYFHFAMTKDAIRDFFLEVADKSPLPIVVYNFPGVVSGLDVDSELLSVLGKHPNIVAVKLTCGGIAKVERVAAEFGSFWSKGKGEEFRALAGQSDWLVPALAAGGTGCITGLANLYPKVRTSLLLR
jgi:dihydrodipicolinate synthase/N-acetylneuraminate lyase